MRSQAPLLFHKPRHHRGCRNQDGNPEKRRLRLAVSEQSHGRSDDHEHGQHEHQESCATGRTALDILI